MVSRTVRRRMSVLEAAGIVYRIGERGGWVLASEGNEFAIEEGV